MPPKTQLTRRFFSTILLRKALWLGVVGREIGLWGGKAQAFSAETERDAQVLEKASTTAKKSSKSSDEIDYLRITEAEWRKRLTAAQFQVARKHGTERAFSGKYHQYKKDGAYRCVCCKAIVFDSQHKFDSGTGWPSFWQPFDQEMIGESRDDKLGYPRTEVHCKRCHAHLGHVFQDAPKTPTGLRFCINSVCLEFVPRKEVDKLTSSR